MNKIDIELCKMYFDDISSVNTKCIFCDKTLTMDNVYSLSNSQKPYFSNDGGYICKECANKNPHCEYCGRIKKNSSELIYVEDAKKYCCDTCMEEYTSVYICYHCNKAYEFNGEYIQHHGKICKKCLTEIDYFTCDYCGEIYLSDRYGVDDLCITCANEKVSNCLNYSFKPYPCFCKTQNEDSCLYFGVELECGGAKTAQDVIDFINCQSKPFCYMKRDASIPAYGCEIVTHPATLKYHEEEAKWNNILDAAIKFGLSSDNDKCGIHIHMNKNFFNESEIRMLDYFVNNYANFWKKIARRESHYSEYINKSEDSWGRQTTDRHCALNLSNRNTIELRIFKGTLDIKILFAYLEVTYCLANFVKIVTSKNHLIKNFMVFCKNQNFEILNNYLNSTIGDYYE